MKAGRLFTLAGAILASVGLLFATIAAIVLVATSGFLSDAERTDGTVVDLESRISTSRDSDGYRRERELWYPTVEFITPDGQTVTFASSSGSSPPSHEVGDQVEVAYDPGDPSDARIASFVSLYLLPTIFGGLGVLLLGVGATLLVLGRRRANQQKWLRQNGVEVWAEIQSVDLARNVRINRRHPYVVHATWQDPVTGHTYHATSDYLREDPGPRLLNRGHVRVRYDPDAPHTNLVELD